MIEIATEKEIAQLKDVWRSSFGDYDDYINLFMKNRLASSVPLVCKVDGKIVSVLYLLSGGVRFKNKVLSAEYVYAAATLPEYRGKGYMAELLQEARKFSEAKGSDLICLVPASESLFSFYEKFGYTTVFKSRRIEIENIGFNQVSDTDFVFEIDRDFDTKQVLDCRNSVFNEEGTFIWDENALKYAIDECLFNDGYFAVCRKNGKICGYALYYTDDHMIQLAELCAEKAVKHFILSNIFLIHAADSAEAEFSTASDLVGLNAYSAGIINKGMALPISDEAHEFVELFGKTDEAWISLTLE